MDDLKQLIIDNKIEEAINMMLKNPLLNDNRKNDLIVLLSKHRSNEREKVLGTIEPAYFERVKTQTIDSVLKFIDDFYSIDLRESEYELSLRIARAALRDQEYLLALEFYIKSKKINPSDGLSTEIDICEKKLGIEKLTITEPVSGTYKLKEACNYYLMRIDSENLNSSFAPGFKSDLILIGQKSNKGLILDLSNVRFVDSSGLSAILTGYRIFKDRSFVIVGINHPSVVFLFNSSRLDKYVNVASSLEEARFLVFQNSLRREEERP